MTDALHILALQDPAQQSGGGLEASAEILGAALVACALLAATVLLLSRYKRRRDVMMIREWQARDRMQELCPQGWSARIMLYGHGAPRPDDAPSVDGRSVCVEWTEYERDVAGHTQVAVARRMWARTITGALRGMLADRELDAELERIERKVIEGASGGETSPPAAGPPHGRSDR
jgi:hypothetical protein